MGIPGKRPWFTLHDRPGDNGAAVGVEAPARAIGAELRTAQVTPAMAVTRVSEDFI